MKCNIDILGLRKELRLTQAGLAEYLDVGANYVYLLEAGKRNPSKKIIRKLNELKSKSNMTPLQVSQNKEDNIGTEDENVHYESVEILKNQLEKAEQREKALMEIIKNFSQTGGSK